MTSVEFVIWLRGFMDCHAVGYDLSSRKADVIRAELAKIDGIPLPREKRTVLTTPKPVYPAMPDPLSPPLEVTCAAVSDDAQAVTIAAKERGDASED